MKQLNIAIIGQGRSGRNIHGAYLKSEKNNHYRVAAVVDREEQRRKRALEEYPGCEAFECYTELYGRTDIDLVVNAAFSNEHYQITKDLLEHHFHVIVEKPFARNRYECDNLIRIAEKMNVKLGVFQQSFFAPFYTETKKIIDSGKLGKIQQIDITYSRFSRRWDWQTAQAALGGNSYNTGPHPIGLALGFLKFDKDYQVVFSKLDHVLSSGDADDYAKIILTAPNQPVMDIEINSNDAYPAANIKILGAKGTYQATTDQYEMKYIADGENPEHKLILEPLMDEQGLPVYCQDQLTIHEESGKFEGNAFDVGTHLFYDMMYRAVTKNTDMPVKPEHAAMIIEVIEQVHAQNPLPLKF